MPLSYGTFSHLWAVGRPRVGQAEARDEVRARLRRGGPEAEGAIDVQPRAGFARALRDRLERVECARVEVARLRADDRRRAERRERVGAHAALAVDGHAHEAVATEADEAERLDQRGMRLLADHDGDRRRAEEAVGLDVPVLAGEHRVARRRERAEVRHRRAGHEGAGAASGGRRSRASSRARPTPAVPSPATARRRRRSDPRPRRASWPPAPRAASADHEAEEARAGDAHRGRRAELVEQREHVAGLARAAGNGSRRPCSRATAAGDGATGRTWISSR